MENVIKDRLQTEIRPYKVEIEHLKEEKEKKRKEYEEKMKIYVHLLKEAQKEIEKLLMKLRKAK